MLQRVDANYLSMINGKNLLLYQHQWHVEQLNIVSSALHTGFKAVRRVDVFQRRLAMISLNSLQFQLQALSAQAHLKHNEHLPNSTMIYSPL